MNAEICSHSKFFLFFDWIKINSTSIEPDLRNSSISSCDFIKKPLILIATPSKPASWPPPAPAGAGQDEQGHL